MKAGTYRNEAGDEIEVLYQTIAAREFWIYGTVYCGYQHAGTHVGDVLVTAEGLRKAGYKFAFDRLDAPVGASA